MKSYEAVIGLEVHAQLMTQTKLFCVSQNSFGERPNSQIGMSSVGLPGSLPVLNIMAVRLAVRAGIAFNSKIQRKSFFSRKNYFYPDLPKGYQISQFDKPICTGGFVEFGEGRAQKKINLDHIHLEEDAGKLIHNPGMTLINLNRAGVPLIEVVSRPEIRSPLEAAEYLRKVHSILVHAKVCDGNLEEGNFRCDANVSIRPVGTLTLGTRTEIKNVNSFRFVEKAIEYEIARQIAVVESGASVVQETRGWDSAANKTYTMRVKEDANDYRYFPDPDLPPLVLTNDFIEREKQLIPSSPEKKRIQYIDDWKLSLNDATVLIENLEWAQFAESVVRAKNLNPQLVVPWVISELVGLIKEKQLKDFSEQPVRVETLAEILHAVTQGLLTARSAKKVLRIVFENPGDQNISAIIESEGLSLVRDEYLIGQWIEQIKSQFPNEFSEFVGGQDKVFIFLVGEVMKLSKGRASPEIVHRLIKKYRG